ncbi:DUF805 domain-containing protein [Agarivorans sp. 1_MG-2023]|uniref:DUF805 domain-containing protein n=1 Tax=Agarivorans sp. 1_MG-2023 TaxID=3062634 RepID=UPI0034C6AD6E
MFSLIYMVISIILSVIDVAIGMQLLSLIFPLGMLIPCISIAARRLHDTGCSGWWPLIALIPIIGLIVLIVFLASDSHDDNNYGANPKGNGVFA